MKKTFFIFTEIVILLLCMFPLISFCNNTTEVRIDVYEIKVSCDKNGSFVVNKDNYINEKSFFVGEDATFNITPIPKNGYMVEFIECEPQCNSTLENEQLVITNITDNINVKITFKPSEIPVAGLDSEDNQIIKNETKENELANRIWWIIALICVLIINFCLTCKKNSKK